MDLKELFDSVNNRLAFQPDTAPRALAQELGVRIKDIEQAVREIEGVTFREYRENRRLAHALAAIEEGMYTRKDGVFANQRAHPRWTVPGAGVRYLAAGRGINKGEFSRPFPILDISRGGMAFFANQPARPGRKISLLICLIGEERDLRVEGRIVYSAAVGGVAGYRYRMGVRFQPFAAKKGCNSPEIAKILDQLEKELGSANEPGREMSDGLA